MPLAPGVAHEEKQRPTAGPRPVPPDAEPEFAPGPVSEPDPDERDCAADVNGTRPRGQQLDADELLTFAAALQSGVIAARTRAVSANCSKRTMRPPLTTK